MRTWGVLQFVSAVVVALLAAGCVRANEMRNGPVVAAALGSESDRVARWPSTSPPFALLGPDDAVVRISGPSMHCSGTMVAPQLVLTAHHCVVERGAGGAFSKKPLGPSDVNVEIGGDYLPWDVARVRTIVAPPCGEGGGAGDVAVLVLERAYPGLPTMAPRLDGPPIVGEAVDPIGFGECANSAGGIRRHARLGGIVRATTGETIEMVAAICPGDSGGPIVSRAGRQVVGVVSQSAMDASDRTQELSVMARIDAYRQVLAQARLVADGMDPADLPPISCATPSE